MYTFRTILKTPILDPDSVTRSNFTAVNRPPSFPLRQTFVRPPACRRCHVAMAPSCLRSARANVEKYERCDESASLPRAQAGEPAAAAPRPENRVDSMRVNPVVQVLKTPKNTHCCWVIREASGCLCEAADTKQMSKQSLGQFGHNTLSLSVASRWASDSYRRSSMTASRVLPCFFKKKQKEFFFYIFLYFHLQLNIQRANETLIYESPKSQHS